MTGEDGAPPTGDDSAPPTGDDSAPPTGDDVPSSNDFLRILLLLVGGLSVALVVPFVQAVLAGGLLAYLVAPIDDRLSSRVGATAGAVLTMVVTVVVVLVPLVLLIGVAADQAVSLVRGSELPDAAAVELRVRAWLGPDVDLSSLTETASNAGEMAFRGVVGGLVGLVGGIPALAIGTVVFLFTFFYLLRDRDRLLVWLRAAAPLEPAVMDELLTRTDDLLWAALIGNVIVAAIQAILTVVAFVVLGFGNVAFWGVVTFGLSLLPLIGASIVWIPAVAYLVVVGNIPGAFGLLVYGSVVISGSDNLIRPLAMQRGAHLNPGLLMLGIFGGTAVFGFLGLFVGPVIIGLSKSLVEVLVRERDEPDTETEGA